MGVNIHSNFGYFGLDAWVMANIIQQATWDFCRRFLDPKLDPCGRQYDQMTQAARSGVANIAEGYSRNQTSTQTEMSLFDVSRASLAELMGDYYALLLHRGLLPWPKRSPEAQRVYTLRLDHADYTLDWINESARHILRQKARFDPVLGPNASYEQMANALLILCARTIDMLESYIARQLEQFRQKGGFSENLTQERLAAVKAQSSADPEAPDCPLCGAPMRKIMSTKGSNAGHEFWGCTNWRTTGCKGTRNIP